MFGIDSSGFIIIMIVGLILIGPEKLPEIMVKVGKFMSQMRSMTNDVKRSFQLEFDRVELEKRKNEAMKQLFPEDEQAKEEVQAAAADELAVEAAEMADAQAQESAQTAQAAPTPAAPASPEAPKEKA